MPRQSSTLVWSRLLIIALFGSIALARGGEGLEARKRGAQKGSSKLEVSLRPEKRVYRPGESISLEAIVKNLAWEPVYVYGALGLGSMSTFDLHVYDRNGNKLVPRIFTDSMADVEDRSRFVKLEQNHFLGTTFTIPLGHLNMNHPGDYTMILEYHSPIGNDDSPGPNAWPREAGPVQSKPITIQVALPH